MKIKNTKKFIRTILLTFVIILCSSMIFNHSSYSYNNKKFISIYVCYGDTLWSIASSLQETEYYNGKDIRYIISDIKAINCLETSNLRVGDKLSVPTI